MCISAKDNENRPSFIIALLLLRTKYQQGSIVSSLLAGRFFLRRRSRFLVGPSLSRMGNRPAFFVVRCQVLELDQHCYFNWPLPRAHNRNSPPRGRPCSCSILSTVIKSFQPDHIYPEVASHPVDSRFLLFWIFFFMYLTI